MDQESLVVERIDTGWKFLQEFQHYKPVDLAFWGQSNEDGHWLLYVASREILGQSIPEDYQQVHRILSRATEYFLDPFEVRLIGSDHPAAETAREVIEAYPVRFGTGVNVGVSSDRIRFQLYGIGRAYIYKPLVPVATA